MPNPMDDLQPPLDAAAPQPGRKTNLNLTPGAPQRKFAPPPAAEEAPVTEHGASGAGFGAFEIPEPTPLNVPEWLQKKQNEAGGEATTGVVAPAVNPAGMTPAEQAIWQVKQAMIAPHQAAIDAINANADVIIPLLTDLKQLQGLISSTDNKNEMIDGIKALMDKLQERMSA